MPNPHAQVTFSNRADFAFFQMKVCTTAVHVRRNGLKSSTAEGFPSDTARHLCTIVLQLWNGQTFSYRQTLQFSPAIAIDKTALACHSRHERRTKLYTVAKIYTKIRSIRLILTQMFFLRHSRGKEVIIGWRCCVTTPDNVRQCPKCLPCIPLGFIDTISDTCHSTCACCVADFNIHLTWQCHATAYACDTAAAKTSFRKILLTFQAYFSANIELCVVTFHPYMVRRAFIY